MDLKKELRTLATDLSGPERLQTAQRELFHYTGLRGFLAIPIEPRGIDTIIRGPHFAGTDARGIRQMQQFRGSPKPRLTCGTPRFPSGDRGLHHHSGIQLLQNMFGQVLINFTVPRDGLRGSSSGIAVPVMLASVPD
jgi:hypothetical protein